MFVFCFCKHTFFSFEDLNPKNMCDLPIILIFCTVHILSILFGLQLAVLMGGGQHFCLSAQGTSCGAGNQIGVRHMQSK